MHRIERVLGMYVPGTSRIYSVSQRTKKDSINPRALLRVQWYIALF